MGESRQRLVVMSGVARLPMTRLMTQSSSSQSLSTSSHSSASQSIQSSSTQSAIAGDINHRANSGHHSGTATNATATNATTTTAATTTAVMTTTAGMVRDRMAVFQQRPTAQGQGLVPKQGQGLAPGPRALPSSSNSTSSSGSNSSSNNNTSRLKVSEGHHKCLGQMSQFPHSTIHP